MAIDSYLNAKGAAQSVLGDPVDAKTIPVELAPGSLVRVSPELQHEVEQFLYLEARLLDERRFREWFELLAEDLHYSMPLRYNRLRRERQEEFSKPGDFALFDETKEQIGQRLERMETGTAWAEEPQSRTRHLVTNVVINERDKEGEYQVQSNYLLYRTRLERDVDIFVGAREDVLRRTSSGVGLQLVRRVIILDESVLLHKNLSIFF